MQWSVEDGMVIRRTGDGPALVWIHGLGEQSTSFEPVVRALPGFAHVLVDLPGYGRSPWGEPVTLEVLAARLARWVERDAVVIGHSMGGVLATLVAEQAPVRGVINIEGNLSRGDCTFSARAVSFAVDELVAHGFETMRASVYEAGVTQRALRGYHAAMCMASPAQFHQHALDLVRLSEAETLAPRFAALPCPALYVAGVPDGICARSRELLAHHRVRWAALEPSGHWPFIDREAELVALVQQFAA